MEANGLAMDTISNETVDLVGSIPCLPLSFNYGQECFLDSVHRHVKCTREGIAADVAQQGINIFGYNRLEEMQGCRCISNVSLGGSKSFKTRKSR
jgi:H+-transporting ATPase